MTANATSAHLDIGPCTMPRQQCFVLRDEASRDHAFFVFDVTRCELTVFEAGFIKNPGWLGSGIGACHTVTYSNIVCTLPLGGRLSRPVLIRVWCPILYPSSRALCRLPFHVVWVSLPLELACRSIVSSRPCIIAYMYYKPMTK